MKNPDKKFMAEAIALASLGRGKVSPNPMVGSLIVKGQKIVGRGYHKKAGQEHAEVVALCEAGAKAKGATLYVNLEPCAHFGKTPPCADAIIKGGIKKVVIGTLDPNEVVNGKGVKRLKDAGIEVVSGVLKGECEKLNESYFHRVRTKRPFVCAKAAISCDGKIAAADGSSKWISSLESRNFVQRLRQNSDAIMVGLNTVKADDPRLTVRIGKEEENKTAIVVTRSMDLPLKSRLLSRDDGSVIALCPPGMGSKIRRNFENARVKIMPAISGFDKDGWEKALQELARLGINSILVEGGATLITSLLKASMIDRLHLFIAPKILGSSGRNLFEGLHIGKIEKALRIQDASWKVMGDDVVLEGWPCLQE